MDAIRQLLTEIKEGKSSFRPYSDSKEHMVDFQSVAKLLIYADQQGWLNSLKVHMGSRTANSWYDLVVVQGGLSYKGEQYLINPPVVSSTSSEAQEDIIELKPNFMGLGINLNALWRYFKKKKA